MNPEWTWTNPALSLQPHAAAEPGLLKVVPPHSNFVTRAGNHKINNFHVNTPYDVNRDICRGHLNVDSIHGDNLHHGGIISDETPHGNSNYSGNHPISNVSFGNPNVYDTRGNNSDDANMNYGSNPYAHNSNVNHGGASNDYGYNTAHLTAGPSIHDVLLGHGRVNTSVASRVTDLINDPTLASNTNSSAVEPPCLPANHDGQAISSVPDKNRYVCLYPECSQDFGRPSDLERHWKKHQSPEFECPFVGCRRKGAHGFSRKDNLNRHLTKCKFQPRS